MEITPASLLHYYESLNEEPPADLPHEAIERKSGGSEAVAVGFSQLWQAVHMRRQLRSLSAPERRQLESDICEEMARLDQTDPEQFETWSSLHYIHHWSVTADQSEMLAAAFVQ